MHLARFLKQNNAHPQAIWHSSKKRAQETAGLLAQGLGLAEELRVVKKNLGPDENPNQFLDEMIPENWKELMVVTHLPFLQDLTRLLLETAEAPLAFPPAGVAALEKIEGHGWQILWSASPRNFAADQETPS